MRWDKDSTVSALKLVVFAQIVTALVYYGVSVLAGTGVWHR